MSLVAQVTDRQHSPARVPSKLISKVRVLVIDDDRSTALSLTTLPKADCDVIQISDGDKAYRLLSASSEFDAIVLNPQVKGISGPDLLRYLKSEKRLERIPVVVAVGEDESRLIAEAFAAGAVASLCKPFTGRLLWRTVAMVLPADVAKRKAA